MKKTFFNKMLKEYENSQSNVAVNILKLLCSIDNRTHHTSS
ncbi:hypothetical protein ACXYMX_08920 [Sporosarcina sp. CAU 1771]